jgi:hypothetical protein
MARNSKQLIDSATFSDCFRSYFNDEQEVKDKIAAAEIIRDRIMGGFRSKYDNPETPRDSHSLADSRARCISRIINNIASSPQFENVPNFELFVVYLRVLFGYVDPWRNISKLESLGINPEVVANISKFWTDYRQELQQGLQSELIHSQELHDVIVANL